MVINIIQTFHLVWTFTT